MSEPKALYFLLAPAGKISGHGQLRETFRERRNRKGKDVPFWYLSPELVKGLGLSKEPLEGVVADKQTAIHWLQLRFGGESRKVTLDIDKLNSDAKGLPPGPSMKDIGV